MEMCNNDFHAYTVLKSLQYNFLFIFLFFVFFKSSHGNILAGSWYLFLRSFLRRPAAFPTVWKKFPHAELLLDAFSKIKHTCCGKQNPTN